MFISGVAIGASGVWFTQNQTNQQLPIAAQKEGNPISKPELDENEEEIEEEEEDEEWDSDDELMEEDLKDPENVPHKMVCQGSKHSW